jgi:hypothetical protein
MECTRSMGCACADCAAFADFALPVTKSAIDYGSEGEEAEAPESAEPMPMEVEGEEHEQETTQQHDECEPAQAPNTPTKQDSFPRAGTGSGQSAQAEASVGGGFAAFAPAGGGAAAADTVPPPSPALDAMELDVAVPQAPAEQLPPPAMPAVSASALDGDPGAAPPAEEVFDGPLADRVTHKNWKARKGAALEMAALFESAASGEAPCFAGPAAGMLPKLFHDNNMAVRQCAIEAAISYADKVSPGAVADLAEAVAKPLAEKCLAERRTRAKAEVPPHTTLTSSVLIDRQRYPLLPLCPLLPPSEWLVMPHRLAREHSRECVAWARGDRVHARRSWCLSSSRWGSSRRWRRCWRRWWLARR